MTFNKKRWIKTGWIILSLYTLLTIWGLLSEPSPLKALKIKTHLIFSDSIKIEDILGPVDVACAVGIYDMFTERFSKFMTDEQRHTANLIHIKVTDIDINNQPRFFMIGIRNHKVTSSFASYMFVDAATSLGNSTTYANCAKGSGELVVKETDYSNHTAFLKN